MQVADRLSRRLGLPQLVLDCSISRRGTGADRWVTVADNTALPKPLLQLADTAVWLHYSVPAVALEWLRDLRRRTAIAAASYGSPRLADLAHSLRHLVSTPQLRQWLQHSSLAHLHVHYLRNPAETDFWLYAQDCRLAPATSSAQAA